jgi:hypothetical protein
MSNAKDILRSLGNSATAYTLSSKHNSLIFSKQRCKCGGIIKVSFEETAGSCNKCDDTYNRLVSNWVNDDQPEEEEQDDHEGEEDSDNEEDGDDSEGDEEVPRVECTVCDEYSRKLTLCNNENCYNVECDACAGQCVRCSRVFCHDCASDCNECTESVCPNCKVACVAEDCKYSGCCKAHMTTCDGCETSGDERMYCKGCIKECKHCFGNYCGDCMDTHLDEANECSNEECETQVTCGESDYTVACAIATCWNQVCRECEIQCRCGNVVCTACGDPETKQCVHCSTKAPKEEKKSVKLDDVTRKRSRN